VQPRARETFTPRELVTAYRDFTESGPQYVNTQSGLKASAYWFGTRALVVYEEVETGVVLLVHPMLQALQNEACSRSVNTCNPGNLDRIAHAQYLRDGRLD
jgi:hypothetical protein